MNTIKAKQKSEWNIHPRLNTIYGFNSFKRLNSIPTFFSSPFFTFVLYATPKTNKQIISRMKRKKNETIMMMNLYN